MLRLKMMIKKILLLCLVLVLIVGCQREPAGEEVIPTQPAPAEEVVAEVPEPAPAEPEAPSEAPQEPQVVVTEPAPEKAEITGQIVSAAPGSKEECLNAIDLRLNVCLKTEDPTKCNAWAKTAKTNC